jgi:hypothetical protein
MNAGKMFHVKQFAFCPNTQTGRAGTGDNRRAPCYRACSARNRERRNVLDLFADW